MTTTLGWLAAAGLLAGLVMGFAVAPREATQGNVQRIMYLHVPSVWVAYVAFAVVFAASIVYLARRSAAADRVAHASAELGVLFTGLTIATGSIWGKPTWGTWWTWDARLTSVAILFVMYVGYLLLRGTLDEPERAARAAAVLGIVAALNIPLVHFSVYWWRTLHQPPSLMAPRPQGAAARHPPTAARLAELDGMNRAMPNAATTHLGQGTPRVPPASRIPLQ